MTAQTSVRRMRNGKCWMMEARTTGKTRKRRHKCLDMTRALLRGLSGCTGTVRPWILADPLRRPPVPPVPPAGRCLYFDPLYHFPFPSPYSTTPLRSGLPFPHRCRHVFSRRRKGKNRSVGFGHDLSFFSLFHALSLRSRVVPLSRKSVLVTIVSFRGGISLCGSFIGLDPVESTRISICDSWIWKDWRCSGMRYCLVTATVDLYTSVSGYT